MKKVFMLGLFLSMTLAVVSPIRFANAMVDADYDDEAVAKKGMSTGTVESGTYFENMGRNFKRGFTNILSSPLEIPITIKQYHYEKEGAPILRGIVGFLDGTFQMGLRLGSGAYDVLVAFLPWEQDVAPLEPGTLFEGDAWEVTPIHAPSDDDSLTDLAVEQDRFVREQVEHAEGK